jgi:nucleoside-diphosphate-sugar epimerase
MRIVVTGSSGKLGSVLVQQILASGHEAVPIDVRPANILGVPPTHVVNLTDAGVLIPLFRGADAVCHLGNLPHIHVPPLSAGFINNVGSTHAVFEACIACGIHRVVNASSIQAYGVINSPGRGNVRRSIPRYLPIDEDHPLLPTDAYPLSKAMGEWTAESFCRQEPKLAVFSLRFTAIKNGRPGEAGGPLKLKPPRHFGDSLLTAVSYEDAARACRLCLEFDRPGHTALNIISPRATMAWDHDMIRNFYGQVPEFRGAITPMDALISSERAEKIINFRAAHLLAVEDSRGNPAGEIRVA